MIRNCSRISNYSEVAIPSLELHPPAPTALWLWSNKYLKSYVCVSYKTFFMLLPEL